MQYNNKLFLFRIVLPGSGRVDTAVWMHHLDANKTAGEELDGNYTRMLRAILNKSWRQHPTKHQLYGHLPPITKTIQVRRTRHAGHCWRSRDELISDVLLWTPTYGRAKAGRPARTYIQQLCEDTNVAMKTCQRRWMKGKSVERGSGISVLVARPDDDDDYYFQETIQLYASKWLLSNRNNCLKLYNYQHQIRILDTIWLLLFNRNTWSHIITSIRSEYLKLCNCVQIICIR